MSLPPDASQMFRACAAIAAQHPANVAARKPDTDYGDFLDMLGKHEPFAGLSGNAAAQALYKLMIQSRFPQRLAFPDESQAALSVGYHLTNHMADYYHQTPEQLAELERNTRGDVKRDEAKDAACEKSFDTEK